MFLSREVDIKLCQNYTKSYIYQISYKIRIIKQTIFNKYATNLKTTISYRSLRISDLLLLKIVIFYFALFIGIIDNSITYSLYSVQSPKSQYYVTKTSSNGSAVYWSRDTRDNNSADFQISAYNPFHFSFTVPLKGANEKK